MAKFCHTLRNFTAQDFEDFHNAVPPTHTPDKLAVRPGDHFPPEPTVDAGTSNAERLAAFQALGYVVDPTVPDPDWEAEGIMPPRRAVPHRSEPNPA